MKQKNKFISFLESLKSNENSSLSHCHGPSGIISDKDFSEIASILYPNGNPTGFSVPPTEVLSAYDSMTNDA